MPRSSSVEPEKPLAAEAHKIPELTVLVPVFNEAENVAPLLARLTPALERCVASHEVIFVDDGSKDGTMDAVRDAHARDPRVDAISFSRNFGKEVAIAAGLDHARGRAVVIMDADLQHPPEAIASMVEKWREGYGNVYGLRSDRDSDSALRRALTARFYRLFARLGETRLPPGAGDFRLLDRRAVNALMRMRERARFNKGLYSWIGFKSIGIPYQDAERAFGESKFTYRKLTRFALDGLMSFSTVPLMVWTFIGMTVSFLAMFAAVYMVISTLIKGTDVPGYASLIVSISFLSGIQLMSLGILGEYIGRIFAEVKGRPLYIVAEHLSVDERDRAIRDSATPRAAE